MAQDKERLFSSAEDKMLGGFMWMLGGAAYVLVAAVTLWFVHFGALAVQAILQML